jgi:hypothetical protein
MDWMETSMAIDQAMALPMGAHQPMAWSPWAQPVTVPGIPAMAGPSGKPMPWMGHQAMPGMQGAWPTAKPSGQPVGMAGAPREQLVRQVLRSIEAAMPVQEVVHSLHTQALANPEIRKLPAMQRFGEVSLHLLHSLVAAAGYARRMLAGEMGADMMRGMLEQLRAAQRHHAETKAALTQLMENEAAWAHEPARVMAQALGMGDQIQRALSMLVQPLLAPRGPAGERAGGKSEGY